MIGKLVQHIFDAGFDASVHRPDFTDSVILRLSKVVGKEICSLDWALSPLDLTPRMPEQLLLDACERRVQMLQDAVAKKEVGAV